MEFRLRSVAFAHGDRSDQVPLTVTMLREIPGPDRPDYWLGELKQPLAWVSESEGSFEISHVVLAAQWDNTAICEGATRLPVGIAYVTDVSLLDDERLDLDKIRYVATGVADDTSVDDRPFAASTSAVVETVARWFGIKPRE